MNDKEQGAFTKRIREYHESVKNKTEHLEISYVKIGYIEQDVPFELEIKGEQISQTHFLGKIKQLLARFL